MKLQRKLVFLSMTLALISAWAGTKAAQTRTEGPSYVIFGLVSVAALFSAFLFLGLLRLRPSPYQGVGATLLQLFYASARSYLVGRRVLQEMRRSRDNPRKYQERVLMDILASNSDTDYGKKHNLKEIRSIRDFQQQHPLTTYDQYRPYVERSMTGEENVMIPGKVMNFVVTSGTTGKSKFFPVKDHKGDLDELMDVNYAVSLELCPRLGLLQKQMFHYVAPVNPNTEGGSRIVTVATFYEDGRMKYCFATPPAGYRITSLEDSNYVHLLFALREPNLGLFSVPFIGSLDTMLKQLEKCWKDIVNDIEYGTVNHKANLTDDVRASLVNELRGGDPDRGQELRREFERGFENIMGRVWPHLVCVGTIDNTGIWPSLQRRYAKDIPSVSLAYSCSEGMGLAYAPWFWEERSHNQFVLTRRFLEFIKLSDIDQTHPRTYLLDEVEIDQDYEVVLTQDSGLYRYRLGDVIRFTGRQGNWPVFQFLYRIGLMLNVRYEKMNQVTVKAGIQSALARWPGVTLVEYAVAESTLIPQTSSAFEPDEIMPYYLIFLEICQATSGLTQVPSDQIQMIDLELSDRNSDYERLRREGGISSPRVHIVKPGTFDGLKQFILANSTASANQYKVPRKLRTAAMLEFMLGQSAG